MADSSDTNMHMFNLRRDRRPFQIGHMNQR
jgi:hypothetical protein